MNMELPYFHVNILKSYHRKCSEGCRVRIFDHTRLPSKVTRRLFERLHNAYTVEHSRLKGRLITIKRS